jgi:hypothetical protein
MNWLAWRQHRKQFLVIGILLAIFTAITIPTGLHFWHTYQYALSACNNTGTCNQLDNELLQSNTDQLLLHLGHFGVLILPIILGLFWGVPFLAREYADGTNKLVWTQSVSRRKWLSVKLGWILVGAATIMGAFAALDTWWFRTSNALNLDRFTMINFGSQGIVPVATAIFAVSVGIFFGALFRRTMVALGVTLFLLVATVLIVVPNFVRPYYETPASYKTSLVGTAIPQIGQPSASSGNSISNSAALVLKGTIVSSSGQPLDWAKPPSQCIRTAPAGFVGGGEGVHQHAVPAPGSKQEALGSQNGGPVVSMNCLQSLGYEMDIKYQPSYRYWDFQRIETGLYLALSLLPIGATYWLVVKRDA